MTFADDRVAGLKSVRYSGIQLLIASFIVLAQELALIRWLPGQVRVLSYFPNLVLISAFLGLGIGALRSGRRSLLWLWPASLVVLVLTGWGLGQIAFTQEAVSDYLWLLYFDLQGAPVFPDVRPPILLCFILSMVSFIPLGQYIAERLEEFGQQRKTLWGYSLDLLGSFFGVIVFSLISFYRTFPAVWFLIILVGGLILIGTRWRLLTVYCICAASVLAVAHYSERAEIYSPYYAISTDSFDSSAGTWVSTNGSLHQYAAPLERDDQLTSGYDLAIREGYHIPYELMERRPGTVLVLGAGTGNDVSVALDRGADRVDVVEIDPSIIELGRRIHPNNPYDSDRVRIFNMDARNFLNETDGEYDLIVFGTLDSMTRLSALSSVRLDNFVYTVEALRAAKRRLAPGGGIAMYFMAGETYIRERLIGLHLESFGRPPVIVRHYFQLFNLLLMSGPAFEHLSAPPTAADESANQIFLDRILLPTDDWPFLYTRDRSISSFYLMLLALIGLCALLAIFIASPDLVTSARRGKIDLEMFLFGAGFLLLETKSVTEMNLAWGATWFTSAVVFGSILLTLLAATVAMQLRPLGWRTSVIGLVAALLLAAVSPTELLLVRDLWLRLLLSLLFIGVPIFFASAMFAIRFRSRSDPGVAFGWNVLGAVAGGMLEFSSMVIGFHALSLLALACYLFAILAATGGSLALSASPLTGEEAVST